MKKNETSQPLVSCIMPTYNRRRFVPLAIRYFLAQDYRYKELLILDDSDDSVDDLVPDHPQIRYMREPKGRTLGAKRNRLCELARGDIIAHWDDDDWYAAERLSRQVSVLCDPEVALCGIECLLYYDMRTETAHEYRHEGHGQRWLSLLCYRRSLWIQNTFTDIQVGSDTRFLWQIDPRRMAILEHRGLNVCFIHNNNVSPKRISGHHWCSISVKEVQSILGEDWQFYARDLCPALISDERQDVEHLFVERKGKEIKTQPETQSHWTVIIPTYNRPEYLADLLSELIREAERGICLEVRVYDDASTKDYTMVREIFKCRGWYYRRAEHHHGKTHYWKWIDQAFRDLELRLEVRKILFIHDDYRLCDYFFEKALRAWESIKDPNKLAITVSVNEARRNSRCWTGFDPIKVGHIWKTQWVDGAFVAEKRFFDILGYRVPPVKASRWKENPNLSSGVGRNISVALNGAGYSLFRTNENLAHHVEGPSMLNTSFDPERQSTTKAPRGVSNKSRSCLKAVSSTSCRKKWVVVVMTYERPLRLLDLLRNLEEEKKRGINVEVRVFNDASPSDYSAPKAVINRNGWYYNCAKKTHGKQRFWQWVTDVYRHLRDIDSDTLLAFLQDDVRLCKRFFERAESEWTAIKDSRKVTLNILVDSQREGRPCWTGINPIRMGNQWRTQWVDQLFITDRRFFEIIHFRVPPISSARWRVNPSLSSGVGQTLSLNLHKSGLHMYCVNKSLVVHVDGQSVMNGGLRKRETMTTIRFVDGDDALSHLIEPRTVLASLATIPERQAALHNVIRNILPQVDRLRVFLNNFDYIPECLEHPKIDLAESSKYGDLGDSGKFFWSATDQGYLLSCDDDLVYPPNYVARVLCAVERYNRNAVVGFHGILLKKQVRSYYRDRTIFHFSQGLEHDQSVHILGSGCAAWCSDCLTLSLDEFRVPNMADIWLGRACQRQEIPVITIARKPHWLGAQPIADTIYNKFVCNDSLQTRMVNEIGGWRTFPMHMKDEVTGCD